MTLTTYSAGWGARVTLGAGQAYVGDALRASIRHPSRTWHDAPRLRAFGRSPGTAHRLVHRLAALGVIAIQTTLGRGGGVRFTFGVRRWRRAPIRRVQVARIAGPPGQLAAWAPPEEPEPEELEPPARPKRRGPPAVDHNELVPPIPPSPGPIGETFGEKMRRYGLRPDLIGHSAGELER